MRATFFTNSFNRLPLLQNLLRSFEECNRASEVEWVICDYGSTDGSREWLADYARQASFPVKVLIDDENKFFDALHVPVGRRARIETILRKYRNEARKAAEGDYIFDVGTDHQFVRKADFVDEVEQVFAHREAETGRDDLAGISVFGYFRWRLDKLNNERERETGEAVPYFVSSRKAYVDYSVMKRATAEKIGPYVELGELGADSDRGKWWLAGNHLEMEYMERCRNLGYVRAFLKYPFSVTFGNKEVEELSRQARESFDLLAPLWTLEDMQKKFTWLSRPVSSEELRGVRASGVLKRGRMWLERWV